MAHLDLAGGGHCEHRIVGDASGDAGQIVRVNALRITVDDLLDFHSRRDPCIHWAVRIEPFESRRNECSIQLHLPDMPHEASAGGPADARPPRPLDDIVVLDLSQFAAGPYATQFLADAGARVVKVEIPGTGDAYRHEGPQLPGGGPGEGTFFMRFGRNKESLALDIRTGVGRGVFERLVRVADVLIENFKAGSLQRLGFDWEHLRELNPRLIYATITGYLSLIHI